MPQIGIGLVFSGLHSLVSLGSLSDPTKMDSNEYTYFVSSITTVGSESSEPDSRRKMMDGSAEILKSSPCPACYMKNLRCELRKYKDQF